MNPSIHGRLAAAALCALLVACGGSGDSPPPTPTTLPASVAITGNARAEAGAVQNFSTDLAVTKGLAFRWDFGDGGTASGATTSHAYAKPGTYQVTLAVANEAEDLRTTSTSVEVGAYANVAGLNCSQADSSGWCWQHASATGHQINDVFFLDAGHAWAVGDALTILKSTDGGATWSQVPVDSSFPGVSLTGVRFYDATHGMALTDQGGALRTADGGSTWTPVAFNGVLYGAPLSFVDFRASRIILQGPYYYYGGAMSVDGGDNWTSLNTYGTLQATGSDCWSLYSGAVYHVAGCSGTGTNSLTPSITNGYLTSVTGAFMSDTQALVIGSGYTYTPYYTSLAQGWSTSDGGATWNTFTPTGLPQNFWYGTALQMFDAQSGVLYGTGDLSAYLTQDGGLTWTAIASSPVVSSALPYGSYARFTGITGGMLWQSQANHVAVSTDRGRTWHDATVHAEDNAPQYYSYSQAGAASVTQVIDANDFVVSVNHRYYVTSNGGQDFRRILGPDARDAGAVAAAGEFSDFHNGKFLTANGALLSTADGGRTWTRSDYPNTSGGGVALHFTSATEGWLVLGGRLAHTTDGGTTWSTPLLASTMVSLQGMSWGDATHGWTWNLNALFMTADAGATWTQATLPNNVTPGSAVMTGALAGVVGSYSGVATTQDGGATWQTTSVSTGVNTLVRASGQTVWSLGGYGGVQRSKDGGRTWHAVPLAFNGSAIGLSFADDTHGWMITNSGNVLHTIDGGDSWMAQPVGADLVLQAVVAADPMTAWIMTRDGQILSTATSGQ